MKFVRNHLKIESYSPVSDKEIKTWLKDMSERNIIDPNTTHFILDINNYKEGSREIDILNTFCEKWDPINRRKLQFAWRHDILKYMEKIGLKLLNHPTPRHSVFEAITKGRLI